MLFICVAAKYARTVVAWHYRCQQEMRSTCSCLRTKCLRFASMPRAISLRREGTLGVIIEAEVRLLPKPEGLLSGVVFFDNEANLLSFVSEARERSLANR